MHPSRSVAAAMAAIPGCTGRYAMQRQVLVVDGPDGAPHYTLDVSPPMGPAVRPPWLLGWPAGAGWVGEGR